MPVVVADPLVTLALFVLLADDPPEVVAEDPPEVAPDVAPEACPLEVSDEGAPDEVSEGAGDDTEELDVEEGAAEPERKGREKKMCELFF